MTLEALRIKHPTKLFINGEWVSPSSATQLNIISPHTGEVAGKVAAANAGDIDLAVTAARRAFDDESWSMLSVERRRKYLKRMLDYLNTRANDIDHCATIQVGQPITHAAVQTAIGMMTLDFMGNGAGGFEVVERHPAMDPKTKAFVVHEPVGVVAAVAPWNAAFSTMISKVAPALLAGCTVVMKPAPESPLEAFYIAEAAEAVGLPAGVLNLVPAERAASEHLIANQQVDKVSFTGSTRVGQQIGSTLASRIGRYTLELGGKSAALLLDDFDLHQAAKTLTKTISMNSGQVCSTLSRAIVPKAVQAQLAESIKQEMAKIRVGDPNLAETDMGPLAVARQIKRVQSMIQTGIDEGATLVCGGKRPSHCNTDAFIEPTLFTDVESHMTIAQEEIFGPVLVLIGYDDEDDAVRIANDSNYGLFGAVLTHDVDKAYKISRRIRTGSIGQGGFRMDLGVPFGGFKKSGIGREGGAASVKEYTETKSIILEGEPSSL